MFLLSRLIRLLLRKWQQRGGTGGRPGRFS
jgi:hypothetical protein